MSSELSWRYSLGGMSDHQGFSEVPFINSISEELVWSNFMRHLSIERDIHVLFLITLNEVLDKIKSIPCSSAGYEQDASSSLKNIFNFCESSEAFTFKLEIALTVFEWDLIEDSDLFLDWEFKWIFSLIWVNYRVEEVLFCWSTINLDCSWLISFWQNCCLKKVLSKKQFSPELEFEVLNSLT